MALQDVPSEEEYPARIRLLELGLTSSTPYVPKCISVGEHPTSIFYP